MTMPTLDFDMQTEEGKRGWTGYWYAHEDDESMVPLAEPIRTQYIDETKIFIRYVFQIVARTQRLIDVCPQHVLPRRHHEEVVPPSQGPAQAS